MKSKGRDYLFYLEDMLESTRRILEYTDGLSFDEFKASNLKTDAYDLIFADAWPLGARFYVRLS